MAWCTCSSRAQPSERGPAQRQKKCQLQVRREESSEKLGEKKEPPSSRLTSLETNNLAGLGRREGGAGSVGGTRRLVRVTLRVVEGWFQIEFRENDGSVIYSVLPFGGLLQFLKLLDLARPLVSFSVKLLLSCN